MMLKKMQIFIYISLFLTLLSMQVEASMWRPVAGLQRLGAHQQAPERGAPLRRSYSQSQRELRQSFYPAAPLVNYYPVAYGSSPPGVIADRQPQYLSRAGVPGWRPQRTARRAQRSSGPYRPMFTRQYGWRPAIDPWIAGPGVRTPRALPSRARFAHANGRDRFRPAIIDPARRYSPIYRPPVHQKERSLAQWIPAAQNPWLRRVAPVPGRWRTAAYLMRPPRQFVPDYGWMAYRPAGIYYPPVGVDPRIYPPENYRFYSHYPVPYYPPIPAEERYGPQEWWDIEADKTNWQASCYRCSE